MKKIIFMMLLGVILSTSIYAADDKLEVLDSDRWCVAIIKFVQKAFIAEPMSIVTEKCGNIKDNTGLSEKVKTVLEPLALQLLMTLTIAGFVAKVSEIDGLTIGVFVKPIMTLVAGTFLIKSNAVLNILDGIGNEVNKLFINNASDIFSSVELYKLVGDSSTGLFYDVFITLMIIVAALISLLSIVGIVIALLMRMVKLIGYKAVSPLFFACIGNGASIGILSNFLAGYAMAALEIVFIYAGIAVMATVPSQLGLESGSDILMLMSLVLLSVGMAILCFAGKMLIGGAISGAVSK